MTRVLTPQKTNFNLSLGQTRLKFYESTDGEEFFLPKKMTFIDPPWAAPAGQVKIRL